jgi:hypothetical protein
MKPVRATATILFYITRVTSLLFLITATYAFIVILLSLYVGKSPNIPIDVSEAGSFVIFYPFTRIPFLAGDYTTSYFVVSLLTMALYGIFLWLLSGVFLAFKRERLFTLINVLHLKRFYLFNIFVPLIFLLSLVIFSQEVRDAMVIVFLHIMIGVFAFFMAAIFKQGLLLQEEQDLTL